MPEAPGGLPIAHHAAVLRHRGAPGRAGLHLDAVQQRTDPGTRPPFGRDPGEQAPARWRSAPSGTRSSGRSTRPPPPFHSLRTTQRVGAPPRRPDHERTRHRAEVRFGRGRRDFGGSADEVGQGPEDAGVAELDRGAHDGLHAFLVAFEPVERLDARPDPGGRVDERPRSPCGQPRALPAAFELPAPLVERGACGFDFLGQLVEASREQVTLRREIRQLLRRRLELLAVAGGAASRAPRPGRPRPRRHPRAARCAGDLARARLGLLDPLPALLPSSARTFRHSAALARPRPGVRRARASYPARSASSAVLALHGR
jgi:hypothetical protein